MFGGNDGVVNRASNPPAAIVKNVLTDDTEIRDEEIIEEIKGTFPDAEIDLFKKDNKFTGTLKIKFNTEDELENALNSRLTLFQQRYKLEQYKYRPRVIICRYCQKLGHVSRICENRIKGNPRCGKCAETSHETKDCPKQENDYKCCYCDGNHETGAKQCEFMKTKLEQIEERSQNGY